MSSGLTLNLGNDVASMQALAAKIPTLPTIPTLASGATAEQIAAAQEAYDAAHSQITAMLPDIQDMVASAMGPVNDHVSALKSQIADSMAQIAPLMSIAPIGGLSLNSMGSFATNVTGAFNAMVQTMMGPSIASLTTIAGQLPDTSAAIASLSAAVAELSAKIPASAGGISIPAIPSLPALPAIPKIPSL